MSAQLNNAAGTLDAEMVSPEAIREVVAQCFAESGPERALELATPEEVAVVEEAEMDGDDAPPEIETAEELSLKNGVYHEIKRKLNERYGISLHEIAFIHEADTPAKKAALFKAVNQGRVRVLLGSTSKLGTGVNVQKRLVALHHVDEPWKPAELEQREGRILRQGNIYPEAFIFHYVTERSFDGYMLQTLESKARFISQIMAGEVTARTAEDVGDMVLTVAQVKAIASGNPLVQKRIELEVKLVKLDRLRAAYFNNRAAMRADLEELPERIAAQEAELRGHEEAINARLPLDDDAFRITLKKNLGDAENTAFDKRERAGAHLRFLADLLMDRIRRGAGGTSLTEEVGSYRGFKVSVHVSGNSRFANHSTLFNYNSEIHLRASAGGTTYVAQIGESNVGITQSIDYQLRHLEDRLEQARSGLEMLQSRLQTVQAEVDKPWAFASEYRVLRRRYEQTGVALQSAGLEIENNLTFTAEDSVSDDEEPGEAVSDLSDVAQHSSEVDELAARHNPFTGLEDFPIIVDELEADDRECGGAPQSELTSPGSGMFDFEGIAEAQAAESEETDIFLTSHDADDQILAESLRSSTSDGKNLVESEDVDEEEMWRVAEAADDASPLSARKVTTESRLKTARKVKQPTDMTQIGFLW